MDREKDDLYIRLQRGPAVLLLGQAYLRLESGTDPFLSEVLRKYGKAEEGASSYSQILNGEANKSPENSLAWMQERCQRLSIPKWLQVVSNYPWSSVYTSAIDSMWPKAFRLEWRELHFLFDEKYKPLDARNRTRLYCTHLFGSVSRTQENERPPLTGFELSKRRQIAIGLARRLPEIITPFGVLLIEGYGGQEDWLQPEDLFPIIDNLTPEQTYIFSATSDLEKNPFITELVRTGKIVLRYEGLSTFLQQGQTAGYIQLGRPTEEEEFGQRIQIGDKSLTVPAEVWNRVNRSATIIDDTVLLPPPTISQERRYREFRNFLAESSIKPVWLGYGRGFAFSRDFEQELLARVKEKINSKEQSGSPIILHGQTGTGKTVSLGALAYRLRKEARHPVLFIERKSQRPIQSDLDTFCMWVESHNADPTIIIWDGMVEPELYHNLFQFLASRGRKAVIVGSYYRIDILGASATNFIDAPYNLSPDEVERFGRFLDEFEPSLSKYLQEHLERQDNTFLSALYRLLPPTREQIQTGVVKEVGYAEQEIQRKIQEITAESSFSTVLGHALLKAGLVTSELYLSSERKEIGGEEMGQLEELIGLIMVPGRFGLFIPIELLLRAIGKEEFVRFAEILNGIDIFRWYEDNAGNISVGPRNALEARLLAQARLGGAKTEIAFARQLISEIRDSEIFFDNPELQFAVDLIRNMGPNGQEANYFAPYFLDLSETLREIREERGIQNPRLMLQEASLLRETVVERDKSNIPLENAEELLADAEVILRQAIDLLVRDRKTSPLRSLLLVELGSLLGTRLKHILSKTDPHQEAKEIYHEARTRLFEARASNPENYYLIDVLSWTVKSILQDDSLDIGLQAEAEADILHAFDMAENEEFGTVQQERFNKRRMEIGEVLGKSELSEKAFQALLEQGSAAGYYLRALHIAGELPDKSELSSSEFERCKQAVEYLESNMDAINNDGRCLYLLLRFWWLTNVGRPMFSGTRLTLPLSQEGWRKLQEIVLKLMAAGEAYYKPSLKYLQGLTSFHLGQVENALEIFGELKLEVIPIRRRILRSYLSSTAQGRPAIYHGSVSWVNEDRTKGDLYVEEIRRTIPFFPRDFNRPDIQTGETVNGFHIAFNYLGPLADPPGYFRTQKGRAS